MKRVSLWLGMIVLFSIPALMAQRTLVVQISLGSDGQIQVSPDRVEINRGDRVRWQSTGPARDRFEVEFESVQGTRGPFRSNNNSENPSRGRFSKQGGEAVTSGEADTTGEFKYSVFWIQEDGTRLHLDPVIVVR